MRVLDYNIQLTEEQIREIVEAIQRQCPEVYSHIYMNGYNSAIGDAEDNDYCDYCGYAHTGHCHDEY